MSENGKFTGEITPDTVVSYAKLAKKQIVEQGLANPECLEFHYPPMDHEQSDAAYLLEQSVGKAKGDMLYVAVMAPNGHTTTHFHETPVVEEYLTIAGQLFVNGEPIPPEGVAIFSGVVHQATTRNEGSLTVIFMENGGLKKPEERHRSINSQKEA